MNLPGGLELVLVLVLQVGLLVALVALVVRALRRR